MKTVTFKPLSSLAPVLLNYEFNKVEKLNNTLTDTTEGFVFSKNLALNNFQDVSFNQYTCLTLTTGISLSAVFKERGRSLSIGTIPATVNLQPVNNSVLYVTYKPESNNFTLKSVLDINTNFYIAPISNNEVEIFVNNKYLQVQEAYPYTVILNEQKLDNREINRQRFFITFKDDIITISTLTNTGYRYLAIDKNDNVLRATGCLLGNSSLNNYLFNCRNITYSKLNYDFTPSNSLVTYYFQPELEQFNKTLDIKKLYTDLTTNLLIDFPIDKVVQTNQANINIANLKTTITPTGAPTPIDNLT